MDAAAGLDNNATNPFANNDAATTGEHVQKDPFLLDLDSFKQQTTDINSVPNNDFFLGLERSTNGKRSAEDVFDDDDFGPESNVDEDGTDNLQPQINDTNSFDQSPLDEKSNDPEGVIEHNLEQLKESFVDDMEDYEQQQITPTLLAAKAIAEGVNNSNYANPDGLLNRLEEEMDIAMDREFNKGENQFSRDVFGDEKVADQEDGVNPTAITDDVHDGNVADNVADSGEESEDEWNYFKGNTAAETDKENIDPTTKTRTVDNLEGDDFDMSQLNPNAAEFVPVSPTRNTASPPCMALLNDPICARSPKRIPTENVEIDVPEPNDFETEIRSRPSDVSSNTNNRHAERDVKPNKNTSLEDMENYLNGKDDDGELQSTKSSENFHFGPNATPFSTPASFLNQSEAFSTKANFGDESTATYLDTTSTFSPDKNASSECNNPFGDQTDFQTIINKESDPMSMSFYQDKDDKTDTNPFDLNKVQMLPDDLDEFLAKPDEVVKVSDLPKQQDQFLTTDLDKPPQDEDLLSGIRELPKSPIEDIKTPEPTFDENLCPNNEVIEKENTENVCETRNMSSEMNELCGQIKNMAMDDSSFTESEIEFKQAEKEQLIYEQREDEKLIDQQEEPQICVMKMQEGTDLIECHMMAPSQFEDQSISPEPIQQEVKESVESPQPIIELNQPLFSPELEPHMEPELIETPVDDVTSSIKDDVSPVQLPPTELIPDLPLEVVTVSAAEEKTAPIVETVVAAAAGVVATGAAVIAVGSKKAPQKKAAPSKVSAAAPKSATRASATSPTKSTSKTLSATKPPTPRPTPISKSTNSAATTAGKLTLASPRPKTTPLLTKSPAAKPLLNGEPKSSAMSKPSANAVPKQRVGALPLNKPQPAKPASAARPVPPKPLGASTRPATAPAASKTTSLAKPSSTLGTLSKPKSTATSMARTTSATSKLSSATSVSKTTTTVTKTSSSTLTSTNKLTAAKTSAAAVPPKPRPPITRAYVPAKAPDAEKQNKENVNKQTASRTTTARTNTLTNGKPATTTRKIEPKIGGVTAKTTVSKNTTATTTTRLTATKKPGDTKSATKTVTKTTITTKASAKINGLPNGLSENTITSTTVVENNDLINAAMVVDDLMVKDNSPIIENSQLIDPTAAD